MPHISNESADDRLPDFARAHRTRRHRNVRGVLVSVEVIQFIRRGREDVPTDFPTIAFRVVVQDSAAACADVTSNQPAEPERRET